MLCNYSFDVYFSDSDSDMQALEDEARVKMVIKPATPQHITLPSQQKQVPTYYKDYKRDCTNISSLEISSYSQRRFFKKK